jgi:hypothetical protein
MLSKNQLIDLNSKISENILFIIWLNKIGDMYKLIFEPCEKCKLVFKPKRSTEIRKIFMNDTYWYPQKIEDNQFISLNISSVDTLNRFIPLALPKGGIFGAFPINDNEVCYVYSGTLTDNPISASFGLRPFFATSDTLIYLIPDEDFKKNICQDVNMYIRKVIEDGSGPIALTDDDSKILRKILTIPIAANLDLYARFFEIYCEKKCKAHISYVKSHKYCTAKVGLHPLLYIMESIPTTTWIKEHDRDLFVYLLQQDFLVDWKDIADLDETKQRRILSEMQKNLPEISRFNFDIKVKEIVKDLIDKRDIFTILYFLSRHEGGSATLKRLFDNLFLLLPKEAEKYLNYPKFQPNLFIDGFEIHFILMDTLRNIDQMKSDLKEIFDEVVPFRIRIYEPEQYIRYRFVCRAKRDKYIDYMDLPDILEDTCKAIITLANRNKMKFMKKKSRMKESWLKRLNLKIVTPPQFENTTLEAFSKKWILQRKVSEDIERKYLFTIEDGNKICEKWFDKGTIPKKLKIGLDIIGLPLSKNALIERKKSNVWMITDDKNHFIIIRRDVWVDIYVEIKAKIVSADVFCDYGCLVDQETKFNFFRDVQANYAYLNRLLEEKFDFKMVK